jgi:hypothetical protein
MTDENPVVVAKACCKLRSHHDTQVVKEDIMLISKLMQQFFLFKQLLQLSRRGTSRTFTSNHFILQRREQS